MGTRFLRKHEYKGFKRCEFALDSCALYNMLIRSSLHSRACFLTVRNPLKKINGRPHRHRLTPGHNGFSLLTPHRPRAVYKFKCNLIWLIWPKGTCTHIIHAYHAYNKKIVNAQKGREENRFPKLCTAAKKQTAKVLYYIIYYYT